MSDTPEHLPLSQYLNQVNKAIKAALPDTCWVVAELSAINKASAGHVYLEILESENGREVAKVKAVMFKAKAASVLAKWKAATGGEPQAGMKLLMQVKADFNIKFGFSLQITSIDPSYTLGDMQMKLQQLIEDLKAKDYFEMQRRLPAPSGYWRVAVISPHAAAGLADFKREADMLNDAGVCAFEYFAATFQGTDSSASIRSALAAVYERHKADPFDVVCVIRGGGSKADLAWLNDPQLAAWLCRLPIPVFTGIGHEIDESVLDLVAHKRFDTPSKVIGFFRSTFQQEAAEIVMTIEQISTGLHRMLDEQKTALQHSLPVFSEAVRRILGNSERALLQVDTSFKASTTRKLTTEQQQLHRLAGDFARSSQRSLNDSVLKTHQYGASFFTAAQALVQKQKSELELNAIVFEKTNPLSLLGKGFALVRGGEGEIVTTAAQARSVGNISLTFADGMLPVAVSSVAQD